MRWHRNRADGFIVVFEYMRVCFCVRDGEEFYFCTDYCFPNRYDNNSCPLLTCLGSLPSVFLFYECTYSLNLRVHIHASIMSLLMRGHDLRRSWSRSSNKRDPPSSNTTDMKGTAVAVARPNDMSALTPSGHSPAPSFATAAAIRKLHETFCAVLRI